MPEEVTSGAELDVGVVETAGLRVLLAVTFPREWIHRRVESVSFVDEATIRRRVSVDFTLAEWGLGAEGLDLVPLARLAKQPLVAFSISDEAGGALPVLTSQQNGLVSTAALVAAAESVLVADSPGTEVPIEIREDLRRIVCVPGGAPCDPVAEAKERQTHSGTREKLFDLEGFDLLAQDLRDNFLLIVSLDNEKAGSRRIVKYDYVESFTPSLSWRRLLGWEPIPIRFEVPLIGMADSYYFEFEVPDGLAILSGVLRPTDNSADQTSASPIGDRLHLMISEVDERADSDATVEIAPSEGGVLRMAYIGTFAICISLLAASIFAPNLARGEADASAALLMAAPGVLATLLIRPDENRLASLLLRGLRLQVLAAAALSFVGAGVVATGPTASSLNVSLLVLGVCAAIPFFSLAWCAHVIRRAGPTLGLDVVAPA